MHKVCKIGFLVLLGMLCAFLRVDAVSAQSAILIDGMTGAVLFAQNADEQLPMASTTKIMTAIVAIEQSDLDRVYTVKRDYTLVEGSSMYLKEGEQLTLRETLYGLLLLSGNDAALAIAGECGGMEAFVAEMNETAVRLGLTHTHFDNPNGLDGETHYTTARELATLAAYAMQNATFREIVATKSYAENGRYMTNHNKLLRYYADAVGVKTGFTKKSGRCLVSAAERNGRRLIGVTLNAPDDWNDHITMLENGFAQYKAYTLHHAGDVLRHQPVIGGSGGSLPIAAQNTLELYLTAEEYQNLYTKYMGARFTYAPIHAGSVYGTIAYCCEDTVLAQDTLRFVQGAALLPPEKGILEQLWDKIHPM